MRCIEVATGREVEVVSGDARLPTVTYYYTDDDSIRIVTREEFYLNGYYVTSAPKVGGLDHDHDGIAGLHNQIRNKPAFHAENFFLGAVEQDGRADQIPNQGIFTLLDRVHDNVPDAPAGHGELVERRELQHRTILKGTRMHRSMIFTVQRSTKDGRFYVNLDHGNGKIVLTEPRGRASKSSAFNLCDSIWQGFGYSIDPTHKLQWPPVPYGPHSLKPRLIS